MTKLVLFPSDEPQHIVACKNRVRKPPRFAIIANLWEKRDDGYGDGHSFQVPFAPTFVSKFGHRLLVLPELTIIYYIRGY